MNKFQLTALIPILLIILLLPDNSFGRDKYFSFSAGPSMRVLDNSRDWNTGFTVGFNWTSRITPEFFYGLRMAYATWKPNCGEIGSDYQDYEMHWQSCGSMSTVELFPYVRYAPKALDGNKLDFYLQAGAGLYVIDSNWTVGNTYGLIDARFNQDYESGKPGVSLAGGIIIGNRMKTHFEIQPVFNYIYSNSDPISYLSLSIGLSGPEGD